MNRLTPPWNSLPEAKWSRTHAKHLASRLGYSIHPKIVDEVESLGPRRAITAAFQPTRPFAEPAAVVGMQTSHNDYWEAYRDAEEGTKREMRQERQKLERTTYADYALQWYAFARNPRNAPQEKLVSFFQNVWVVSFQGVKHPPALFDHQNRIRLGLRASYPDLCKVLARSPAMVRYLDLHRNKAGRPNENFAREFFELFSLGEGHYTEQDIKEAARAMTGFTLSRGMVVRHQRRQFDDGVKTVFGRKGRFELDDIIDLAFAQPASATFLPQELAKFYLTADGLPDALLQPLGDAWRAQGFSLPWLYHTFFASELFYAPEYRGNMIKSPEQFVIGLHQDLALDLIPSPRRTLNPLRQMGQAFFNPPNVRGWVGDRRWINSSTLSARRQYVQSAVAPLNREKLNADEIRALEKAEAGGAKNFALDLRAIAQWLGNDPHNAARKLAKNLYIDDDPSLLSAVLAATAPNESRRPQRRAAAWLIAALNTPSYQLC